MRQVILCPERDFKLRFVCLLLSDGRVLGTQIDVFDMLSGFACTIARLCVLNSLKSPNNDTCVKYRLSGGSTTTLTVNG